MAARGDSVPLSWLKAQPSAENAGMLLLEAQPSVGNAGILVQVVGDAGMLLLEEEPSAGNAAHPANALPLDENVKC